MKKYKYSEPAKGRREVFMGEQERRSELRKAILQAFDHAGLPHDLGSKSLLAEYARAKEGAQSK